LQILKPVAVIIEDKQHVARITPFRRDHDHDCANANASTLFNISFNQTKPTDDDNTYDENDSRITHVHTPSSSSRTSLSSHSLPVDYASSSLPSTSTSSTNEFPQQRQQKQRKLKHFVFRDPAIIPPESIASLSLSAATAKATVTATNIHIEDPPSSFYSPALFAKFLMIVMYNLALTLHLQAISFVSSSSSWLTAASNNHQSKSKIKQLFKRSRKYYTLAYELQLETEVDPLFTLALTNNLGLIYHIVNERKKSLICFRNLFSTMMYLMDSHHNFYTNSSQSYEPASSIQSSIKNWDGFLSNVMDILFNDTYEIVAAAA